MRANHISYPTIALLTGASLWGVIWFPMRELRDRGLGGLWLTLLMFGVALVVSLPRTARFLPDFRSHPGSLGLLMLAAGWTNIAFVEAVLDGNILRVLLLFYLSPVWQTLLGWLILRERPSRMGLASLLIAMIGAVVMLYDSKSGLPWPSGAADWYALSSGFAFAVSNVITRRTQGVSVEAKALAVWAGVVVLALAMIGAFNVSPPTVHAPIYLGGVALGVFGILLMTLLVQYGVTHMPVYRSAVLSLIEIVAGAVVQQLFTDEVVLLHEWIGGIMIVTAAWLAARASQAK
ncbi:MAG: DMT family transporter [Pseudomonadota bacterium]